MADIDIEKKRGGIWPWIIGLVVLALLVWLLAELFGGDDDEPEPVRTAVVAAEPVPTATVVAVDPSVPRPAVAAYLAHITGPGEARMGKDHEYTARGIELMATALRELVQEQPGLNPKARGEAERLYAVGAGLTASPDSLRSHADWMHNAAVSAAGVMQGLSESVNGPVPELREQVAQVGTAARAIDPGTELLAQETQVRGFFRESGEAMTMLVNPRP